MTVKDIWDEMPKFTDYGSVMWEEHGIATERWLEKLKAEGDRLQREGLEHHAIAVKYYEKLEAVKTWIENYIDPYLEEDESNITLFRSEGLELKKILEAEG